MIGFNARFSHERTGSRPPVPMVVILIGLLCCLGCTQVPLSTAAHAQPVVARGSSPEGGDVARIGFSESAPTGAASPKWIASDDDAPAASGVPTLPDVKLLPINLDTVFRLACDQNGQILLAREKLQ